MRNQNKSYLLVIEEKESEEQPDSWVSINTEVLVRGSYQQQRTYNGEPQYIGPEVRLSNRIAILPPKHIFNKIEHIRAYKVNNVWYEIQSIELQYPRLLLTLGGIYNEQQ